MNALTKPDAHAANVEDYTGGLLSVIERAARDPNTDVEKMERLFQLQERVLDREAERAFSEAKHAAQAEMPQIKRTGSNDQTKSTYAELDEIAAQTDPIAAKHGFSLSFSTADSPLEAHYRVTCRLRHKGGFFEDYQADVPADTVGMKGNQNKTATHGFGSTMSYGRRYLKLLVWDIATTDDDGRAATTGALIDWTDLETLKARCSQVGSEETRFARFLKVPALAQLPAARFREAMAALDAKETSDAIARLPK
jgi:hypothetical protein